MRTHGKMSVVKFTHLICAPLRMFVCCCLVAAGADDAMAQALPDAAYADSQYSLLQLSTMAEQGDAQAQLLLVTMYDRGQGVPKG